MDAGGARGDVNKIVKLCEKQGMVKCGDIREGATTRTLKLAFAITDRGKAIPFIKRTSFAPWGHENGDDKSKIVRLQFSYEKDPKDECGLGYEKVLKEVEVALGGGGPTYHFLDRTTLYELGGSNVV